jgi:hypothetical protein
MWRMHMYSERWRDYSKLQAKGKTSGNFLLPISLFLG